MSEKNLEQPIKENETVSNEQGIKPSVPGLDFSQLNKEDAALEIEPKEKVESKRRKVKDRILSDDDVVKKRNPTGPKRKLDNAKPQTFILDETLIDKLNRYVDENREVTKSEFVREAIKAHMIRKKFY